MSLDIYQDNKKYIIKIKHNAGDIALMSLLSLRDYRTWTNRRIALYTLSDSKKKNYEFKHENKVSYTK